MTNEANAHPPPTARNRGRPMPSPFPGMDPYLEAHWGDIHAGLVIYIRDAIADRLPPGLRARVEERVVMETGAGIAPNPLLPDGRAAESKHVPSGAPPGGSAA